MLKQNMALFGKLEDFFKDKRNKNNKSDKDLTLPELDEREILDDLNLKPLVQGKVNDRVYIFGKFSEKEIFELMDWSGIFEKIKLKGYKNPELELQYLSDIDQRIFIKHESEVLIHLRLKVSYFRFRFTSGVPTKKLLYIDWLMTRDPLRKNQFKKSLFPGQDAPGLGIFYEISDFVFNLALGLGVKGAFNIPEYFHDAVLFHRQFRFYDPQREAFFRALIRDLRTSGAKKITEALKEGKVFDNQNQVVTWLPGEMISIIDPEFSDYIWNKDYFHQVIRYLKRYKFYIKD